MLTAEEQWRRDTTSDWRRWCDQLVTLATTARDLGADIVIAGLLESTIVDGFATSTSGAGEPGSSGGISDPTGNRVVGQLEHPMAVLAEELRENLAAALKALEAADRQVIVGRHKLKPPVPLGRAEALECINCSRFEIYTPMVRAGRCEECAAFRDTYRRDATEKVVRARLTNSTPRKVARGPAIPEESLRWVSEQIEKRS